MPFYTVENEKTGRKKTVWVTYDRFLKFLAKNPDWHQVFEMAPSYCQPHRLNGQKKLTSDFKNRMDEVKRAHPKGYFPEV